MILISWFTIAGGREIKMEEGNAKLQDAIMIPSFLTMGKLLSLIPSNNLIYFMELLWKLN